MPKDTLLRTAGLLVAALLLAGGAYAQEGTESDTSAVDDENASSGQDIVETLQQSENHQTLARAIEAANFTKLLKGYSDGSFTLFAPTDEAFAQLPEGRLDALLQPENQEELIGLVAYHLTSYGVTAEQLSGMEAGDVAQGDSLYFSTAGGQVMINDEATIVTPDIEASNGIIHAVDTVLMPPGRPSSSQKTAGQEE